MLIIGMGNIGTIYGWALAQSGADITHVVRKGKKSRYENGVRLDVLDLRQENPSPRPFLYRPKVVEEVTPGDGYELVMVPTRHYQLTGALLDYRYQVGPEADFLIFCANWVGPQVVDDLLPRSRYLWGYAVSSGGPLEGVLYANIRKELRIGELDGRHTPRLQSIVDLFGRAGFEADVKENIIEWLWVHHAINAGLIGAALYAGGQEAMVGDLEAQRLMVKAERETLAVLEARGVDLSKYPDVQPFLQPSDHAALAFVREAFLESPVARRSFKAGHFKAAPEEMKMYYFDVLETGEEMGVPMPAMQTMRSRIEAIQT